jgi:hypothetical protein
VLSTSDLMIGATIDFGSLPDWLSGVGTVGALLLTYALLRRELDARRDEVNDRRRAQARLVTVWWTRVQKDSNKDMTNLMGEWPEEIGFRVWAANSSQEAVYDCWLSIESELAEGAKLLEGSLVVPLPHGFATATGTIISIGTLPPESKVSYYIDHSIVNSLKDITVHFKDTNEREWRRSHGVLEEISEPKPKALKDFNRFEESAHTPDLDEPEKFQREVIS